MTEEKKQKKSIKEFKNIYSKLSNIQQELKAPKGQYNDFGKYAFS